MNSPFDLTQTPLQPGTATCSKGFVISFLKVPLACLGSMAAAVQPNGLWNSQKTFYKTFLTSCRPDCLQSLILWTIFHRDALREHNDHAILASRVVVVELVIEVRSQYSVMGNDDEHI